MDGLRELEQRNDLIGLIAALRERVAVDRRVFTDLFVKAWCARRWRHLFLSEAVNDPVALEIATVSRTDRRPVRQKIAEYFLVGEDRAAWKDEQPGALVSRIDNTTLLFCPGLLNGMLPVRAFQTAFPRLEQRFSLRVLRSDSHPVRGCEANMADILAALEAGKGFDSAGEPIAEEKATPPGDVFLIGYSKGGPDLLTLLANHPEVKARVRCVFTWAGANAGSETADGLYARIGSRKIKARVRTVASKMRGLVPPFLKGSRSTLRRLDEYDSVAALEDLTTTVRDAFLDEHKTTLDGLDIPMFTMHGATRHEEVPVMQRRDFHNLLQFDEHNDMQVTSKRAGLPLAMGTDLGALRAHHWDLAYPAFVERRWWNNVYHPFPKEAAATAMVQLAGELGLID